MAEFIGPIEAKYTAPYLDNAAHMDAEGWKYAALDALQATLWTALNQPQYIKDDSSPMRAEWRLRQAEFASI